MKINKLGLVLVLLNTIFMYVLQNASNWFSAETSVILNMTVTPILDVIPLLLNHAIISLLPQTPYFIFVWLFGSLQWYFIGVVLSRYFASASGRDIAKQALILSLICLSVYILGRIGGYVPEVNPKYYLATKIRMLVVVSIWAIYVPFLLVQYVWKRVTKARASLA